MNEEFLKKLQVLKQQYVDSLPDLLQQIKAGVDALTRNGVNAVALDEFYRQVHSLTGSGATYGFASVSDCSRNMENSIKELRDAGPEDHENMVIGIQGLYELLERAIHAAVNEEIMDETESLSNQIETTACKILIADDDLFSRKQLATLLEANGHTVIHAEDGVVALEKFVTEHPDMVIMDVVMPRMNGFESARLIKGKAEDHFVPIIFLTALEREDELVECIRSGGDDFLVKPLNKVILNARIFAMQRIQKLHAELEKYQHDTEQELNMARHVFTSATQRNNAGSQPLVKWVESCGHFSGDVMCYRQSPAGDLYVMLGDFTGHGLRAAIGALPASDIFYSEVNHNSSLVDICERINQKLKNLLPTGQFMCGCFMRLDKNKGSIDIIVAGLPPVVVKDRQGKIDLMESGNLPLGIMDSKHYDTKVQQLNIENIMGIYAMSDGIIEAANSAGEMYGQDKLLAVLESSATVVDSIADLNKDFREYLGEMEPDDDISILGIPLG